MTFGGNPVTFESNMAKDLKNDLHSREMVGSLRNDLGVKNGNVKALGGIRMSLMLGV